VRVKLLAFEMHIKSRWIQVVSLKLSVWKRLPFKFVGMFGEYFGYTLAACKRIAKEVISEFNAIANKSHCHRVILHMFNDAVLRAQLEAFSNSVETLTKYPALFVWILRYAFLSVVEHWLEGRHRHIKLQSSGARVRQGPAGNSALIRKPEALKNMQCRDFLNWVAWKWFAKGSVSELLSHVVSPADLRGKSHAWKLSKIYGYDLDSQFDTMLNYTRITMNWSKILRREHAKP
jgi:hypothetical protein